MLGPSSTIHQPSTMGRVWLDMAAWAQRLTSDVRKVKIRTPRRNDNAQVVARTLEDSLVSTCYQRIIAYSCKAHSSTGIGFLDPTGFRLAQRRCAVSQTLFPLFDRSIDSGIKMLLQPRVKATRKREALICDDRLSSKRTYFVEASEDLKELVEH